MTIMLNHFTFIQCPKSEIYKTKITVFKCVLILDKTKKSGFREGMQAQILSWAPVRELALILTIIPAH